MSTVEIRQIPTRKDNYVYLLHEQTSGKAAAVDPSDAAPVLAMLDELGWELSHILCTHHHNDHIGGVPELKEKTGCTVVGARADAARIPGIDVEVGDGDSYMFHQAEAKVFDTPGHTSGHIAFWFPESSALFCGDTLFALGCGRLFEGTAAQMWDSLSKLRALPDDTLVCCAHEYTQANAAFARSVDPGNTDLAEYSRKIDTLRAAGEPTVPSTLELERRTNPFLRADAADLAAAVGMSGRTPAEVFGEVRTRKDNF